MSDNLAAFEKMIGGEWTWEWAMKKLGIPGQKIFIMEPSTWWELKQSEIHACILLTPSVHAVQEFFNVDNAEEILRVWQCTKEYWQKNATVTTPLTAKHHQPLLDWQPEIFRNMVDNLDPTVKSAMHLYTYAQEMIMEGKSSQVTTITEVCDLLPLVCLWIKKDAIGHNPQ